MLNYFTEQLLKLWFKIGETYQEEQIVMVRKQQGKSSTTEHKWESGFGHNLEIGNVIIWVSIEKYTSSMISGRFTKIRNGIKNFKPNPAHKTALRIDKYLTAKERNFWWRLSHNLIVMIKYESKFNKEGEPPTSNKCPIFKEETETRDHYNY